MRGQIGTGPRLQLKIHVAPSVGDIDVFRGAQIVFNLCCTDVSKYDIFAFSIISQHWDDTGSWNSSRWKTRTHLSYIVTRKAGDGLVTMFFQNMLVPEPQGLTHSGAITLQLLYLYTMYTCLLPNMCIMLSIWENKQSLSIKALGQYWFRWWLVAWWHLVITWVNVDIPSVRSCNSHISWDMPFRLL